MSPTKRLLMARIVIALMLLGVALVVGAVWHAAAAPAVGIAVLAGALISALLPSSRRYVVIDMDGKTLDTFKTPAEVTVFLHAEIDPEEIAVLVYQCAKRVGPPILGSAWQ